MHTAITHTEESGCAGAADTQSRRSATNQITQIDLSDSSVAVIWLSYAAILV